MSRIGIVLLAGFIAWTAVPCRADETADSQEATPERMTPVPSTDKTPTPSAIPESTPSTAAAVPATDAHPEVALPQGDCTAEAHGFGGLAGWISTHTHSCQCARKFWQWLTYYPQPCSVWCSHCGHKCAPTCVPPLYTYFMWHCQAAGCGGAVAHHAPVPTTAVAPVTDGTVTMGTGSEGTATESTAPAMPGAVPQQEPAGNAAPGEIPASATTTPAPQ